VVFFSPPYYRLELYAGKNQSTEKYKSYEEWLEKYWMKTIEMCFYVLKPGGKLCYILSNYNSNMENSQGFQIDILEDLILLLERKTNIINNFKLELTEEHYKIIQSLINKKLSSYKQQDIIKKRLDNQNFIQIEEVIDIFKKNQLSCYYCNEKVSLLYEIVRENKQWTLDRINNDIGHNSGNCVLACLSCNLKRRRIGADAFLFTKQLNIVKKDSETKDTNIV
jgi:hypothetical protein